MNTKQLRQKILDLAIRGKLVPQDPNDEPASVLLERIRAEKERLIAEGKIKRHKKAKASCDTKHCQHLPKGWTIAKLGDIFSIGSAKRIMKSDWCSSGIPFYRTREIVKLYECGSVNNELFISERHYNHIKQCFGVPEANDIMLTAVGTIGIPYIVKEEDCFYYKDASVLCLRNIHKLNPRFFVILIQSSDLRRQIFSTSKGTTVDTITIEKAYDYTLMLPPIKEQERIVRTVEYYLSILGSLESNLGNIQNVISLIKSKILNLMIQGKLVPQDPMDEPAVDMLRRINPKAKIITDNPHSWNLPKGWCWIKVSDVYAPMKRKLPEGNNFWYIDIDSVDNKQNVAYPKRTCTATAPSRASRFTQKGDVVFSMVRPYLRNIALVPKNDCIASTGFYVFHPLDVINSEFSFILTISPFFVDGLNLYMKGDNSPSINRDNVENFVIPLPPQNEQKRIVAKIEELYSVLDEIEASLQS